MGQKAARFLLRRVMREGENVEDLSEGELTKRAIIWIIKWIFFLVGIIIGAILSYNWQSKWGLIGFFVIVVYLIAIFKAPSSRGMVTIVFILLLLVGSFYVFAWQSGWWEENVVERWQNREVSGEGIKGFFTNLFGSSNLQEVGGFEDDELKKEGIGVPVVSFKGTPSSEFKENHPINVVAKLDIGSLSSQSTKVSFDCKLQGYEKESADEIFPEEIILPPYSKKLPNQKFPTQTISCVFEDGVGYLGRKDTRTVELISSFEGFYSRSNISLQVVNQEDIDESEEGRPVDSEYSPGPVTVPIKIDYPQPFILEDIINPYLEVNIITDQRIKLKEVTDFRIYLPEGVISFVDNSACQFDLSNSYVEGNFEVFGLKDDVYNILNKECSDKKCYDDKRIVNSGCYFDVIVPSEIAPIRESVKVEVWYNFVITSVTNVEILESNS